MHHAVCRSIAWAIAISIFAGMRGHGQAPREQIAVSGTGIQLDGRFDEPFWARAPGTEPFLFLGSREPAPRQTRVRLACDAHHLFFAFEADEPDSAALTRTLRPRDSAIWNEDALEIMLQPEPGSRRYFHFAFTPAGSRYDAQAGSAVAGYAWDAAPDWEVAVTKGDGRWEAEVAIPFAALGMAAPVPGELWGLKLCRGIIARSGNRNDDYYSSWSYQPGGSFHDPMGWGRLVFGRRNMIANPAFGLEPEVGGLPPGWRDKLVWQPGQEPAGTVEQVTLDGRNVLRLVKFERAAKDVLPRAWITAPARGNRRYRASASIRARGEVVLCLNAYAGSAEASVNVPMELSGEDFKTVTATCDTVGKGHLIGLQLSFASGSYGEMLVRDVSLVDQGPPPAARPEIAVNHGLDAAAEARVDMKPYARLRDAQGRALYERLIFRDQGTGTEIWRITADGCPASAEYSNMYPWNADGSAFKLHSWERPGGPDLVVEADGTAIRGLPEVAKMRWSRDPDWLVYTTSDRVARLNWRTGARQVLYTVPAELKHGLQGKLSANLDLPGAVYYEMAFGTEAPLYFIDLKTGLHTRLPITSESTGDKAQDWLYSADLTRRRDGTWWVSYSLNHLPHLSDRNPYQVRLVSLDGQTATDALKLERPSGKPARPLYGHGGSQPAGRYKTGFYGGGICLWDVDRWEGRMLLPGPHGGHISWEYHDDWFFAGTNGRPLASPLASALLKVYIDGTWYHVAYGNTRNTEYKTYFFANISPDGTKGSFSSTMLGPANLFWCVISYPEPPFGVQIVLEGTTAVLTWSEPRKNAEIAGYNVYRSRRSGLEFEKLTPAPVADLRFADPAPGPVAFYVVTAVEHSGLESRAPSFEAAVGETAGEPERLWLEAEYGRLQAPLRENLHGSASNLLFVDYREGEGIGTASYTFACRRRTPHALWARVRYQGQGAPAEAWAVSVADRSVGALTTTSTAWTWVKVATALPGVPQADFTITAPGPGFALDKLLLTDDLAYTPQDKQKLDRTAPSTPTGLTATVARSFDVALEWQPVSGALYYQVYRGVTADFSVGQATLISSPPGPRTVEWGLQQGGRYFYRVTAVDAFGNESLPGAAIAVETAALPQVVTLAIEAEQGRLGPTHTVVEEKGASGGSYVKLSQQRVGGETSLPALAFEFEVPMTGEYVVWVRTCPVSERGSAASLGSYAYASAAMDGGAPCSFLIFFPERRKGTQAFAIYNRWVYVNAMRQVLPVRFRLEAGRHRLEIGSEPYHQDFGVDQIVISNDLGTRPPGRHLSWE